MTGIRELSKKETARVEGGNYTAPADPYPRRYRPDLGILFGGECPRHRWLRGYRPKHL